MALFQLYRDTSNGDFNKVKILSIDKFLADSVQLYDSTRLTIDRVKRYISFASNSSDTVYYNFETRKLPHQIKVKTNVYDPQATFSLFVKFKNGRETGELPLVKKVKPNLIGNKGSLEREVTFVIENIPDELTVLNDAEQNKPFTLEVRWDQNTTVRRKSEKPYYFTRLLNFNRRRMADIFMRGEIVPKLSVPKNKDGSPEIFCYEASFVKPFTKLDVSRRGDSPNLVYELDYFMDPATNLFEELGELTFDGQVTMLESLTSDGNYTVVGNDQFKQIFKNARRNGEVYEDGKFKITNTSRNPEIIFDLNPFVQAIESIPGKQYPDKFYVFKIVLTNEQGFRETSQTSPFRINPPVRLPLDYSLKDRFFGDEKKLLIADREARFKSKIDLFEFERKEVIITREPNENIADFDQSATFSLKIKNLSSKDKLLLKACTKKRCMVLREITLPNKKTATYEMVFPLFDSLYSSVDRFNKWDPETSEFLFSNEVFFKIEMKDPSPLDMPLLGYRGENKIYGNNCKNNGFVNKAYEKKWRNWEKHDKGQVYEIRSARTKSDRFNVYRWLDIAETDNQIKRYVRSESKKKSNYIPIKATLLFPKTAEHKRVRKVGILADVNYPDGFIKNVDLGVLTVSANKVIYKVNLVTKAADLNLGDYLNCNIWFYDYDQAIFNKNPAKMKWGKRRELIIRNTILK